jgi:FkbM family methyltransferase
VKKTIRSILKKFNVGITKYNTLEKLLHYSSLLHNSSAAHDIRILQALNSEKNAYQLLKYFGNSKSQLRQDLFALSYLDFKKNGYFVEFGAADGYDLSNTYLMEKELGWSGILAEPAKVWHNALRNYRKCNIEYNCVWKDSNSTLKFNEVAISGLSTISSYSDKDCNAKVRKKGKIYNVKTISLNDLLLKYKAPKYIDYLSIDTEGSEYEILSNFDFSQYTFGVITCEHNFTTSRKKLYSLLHKQGYKRVYKDLSLYDDWYVKSVQPQNK